MGHGEQAREDYERARKLIEQEILERPDDYRLHSALGLVLAGLGQSSEAIREDSLAVEIYPVSRDAVFGPQAFSTQIEPGPRILDHSPPLASAQ